MMNQKRPVLYINILVHDASEAVKDEVAAKVKKSFILSPLKESLANRAAALITLSQVVERMGPRLCQEIPIKMSKKGIQVHVENVFTEENYLVLELQVQHVDAIIMSEAKHKRDDDNAGTLFFKGMFTVIGVKNRDSLEREVLPNILQKKVSVSIREMMKEKLAQKKMTADVEIRTEERQARFFYQTLRLVRETFSTTDGQPKKSSSSLGTESSTKSSKAKGKTQPPPATHVKRASFTDSLSQVVEAATSAVAVDRTKGGPVTASSKAQTTAKASKKGGSADKTADGKKGHKRSSSLARAVEAATASVVATVKKGGSDSSTDKAEKETAHAAMARGKNAF